MRLAVPVILLVALTGPVLADPSRGAVPVPDETLVAAATDGDEDLVTRDGWRNNMTLDELDTTVVDADLAKVTGWPAARRSRRSGDVWVALRAAEKSTLHLSVIGEDQGIVEDYPIGAAQLVRTHAFEPGLFPGRGDYNDEAYTGRIIFAVRVTAPGAKTPDQVVVFRDGRLVRVARRKLGATRWRPVLSVAFGAEAHVTPIETTDPH